MVNSMEVIEDGAEQLCVSVVLKLLNGLLAVLKYSSLLILYVVHIELLLNRVK